MDEIISALTAARELIAWQVDSTGAAGIAGGVWQGRGIVECLLQGPSNDCSAASAGKQM
jgi:hypothetical protein